jgi:hypothetical protein
MGGLGSKLEEIQEFEDAQQMEEKPEEPKRKVSIREKLRTRILRSDPRSASDGVDRTPIAISKQNGAGATGVAAMAEAASASEMNTPENKLKTLSLVDPRSPGVEIDRTPIQIEEPVRRRVLAGDECETPVRAAVHHSVANKLEMDARSQLIIDNGTRDMSGIDGLSPIVSVKPPIDMITIHSSLNDTPKTFDLGELEDKKVDQQPAVQMRTGARGQPSKILQERLRSVVQSQLIPGPTTPQAAGGIVLDESNISVTSSNDTSLVI